MRWFGSPYVRHCVRCPRHCPPALPVHHSSFSPRTLYPRLGRGGLVVLHPPSSWIDLLHRACRSPPASHPPRPPLASRASPVGHRVPRPPLPPAAAPVTPVSAAAPPSCRRRARRILRSPRQPLPLCSPRPPRSSLPPRHPHPPRPPPLRAPHRRPRPSFQAPALRAPHPRRMTNGLGPATNLLARLAAAAATTPRLVPQSPTAHGSSPTAASTADHPRRRSRFIHLLRSLVRRRSPSLRAPSLLRAPIPRAPPFAEHCPSPRPHRRSLSAPRIGARLRAPHRRLSSRPASALALRAPHRRPLSAHVSGLPAPAPTPVSAPVLVLGPHHTRSHPRSLSKPRPHSFARALVLLTHALVLLARALALSRTRARALSYALSRTRARTRARALALSLSHTRSLAHSTCARALALAHAHALALALAHALAPSTLEAALFANAHSPLVASRVTFLPLPLS
jgi:hypothetical protein